MHVVIYTRFSPRKNAAECESCETQTQLCKELASKEGWTIRATFDDADVSGKDEYREKLWAAIEALHRGDLLLVYKRDRLARNVYLSEQINRAVSLKGATIRAVDGDLQGDTPEIAMVRQILAALAEYERKLIGKRTSHAMRAHQRAGRIMSRYAPYGQKIQDGALVLCEVEQYALQTIAQMHSKHMTPYSMALYMQEYHRDAARNGTWHISTIRKIIKRLSE
jgi:DNA invertase Pin-like site-specific DNA recombinase